jgi:Tfp pilus assembly protein PilP
MKLTTAILAFGITAGSVLGQAQVAVPGASAKPKPDVAQQKPMAKPVAKPVAATAQKPVAASTAKPAVAPAAKPGASQPSSAAKPVAKPAAVAAAKAPAPTAPTKATPAKVTRVKAEASKPAAKPAVKPAVVAVKPAANVHPVAAPKQTAKKKGEKAPAAPADASSKDVSVEKAPEPSKNDKTKTISANGRRDPFISPVVDQSAVGSGCSSGKRCLAVEQISLKGVVKAETGMIAVVVNANEKAYFLRENDPVFDGYVLKITGDSIVFKETVQDKLGKPFTKEVTKKLNTPVV